MGTQSVDVNLDTHPTLILSPDANQSVTLTRIVELVSFADLTVVLRNQIHVNPTHDGLEQGVLLTLQGMLYVNVSLD